MGRRFLGHSCGQCAMAASSPAQFLTLGNSVPSAFMIISYFVFRLSYFVDDVGATSPSEIRHTHNSHPAAPWMYLVVTLWTNHKSRRQKCASCGTNVFLLQGFIRLCALAASRTDRTPGEQPGEERTRKTRNGRERPQQLRQQC